MIIEPLKHTAYHTDISLVQQIAAFSPRGKTMAGGGYGIARHGSAYYGDEKIIGGIYQRKLVGLGSTLAPRKQAGRWGISRMKYYSPPETPLRIANPMRAIFGAAVGAYQSLSDAEKLVLHKRARNRSMSGYNLFISDWMQSHR